MKYKIGNIVSINGTGNYKITEIKKHGLGFCDCCESKPYFMYRLNGGMFVNEDQLKISIIN